jgi:hypothetical protein
MTALLWQRDTVYATGQLGTRTPLTRAWLDAATHDTTVLALKKVPHQLTRRLRVQEHAL